MKCTRSSSLASLSSLALTIILIVTLLVWPGEGEAHAQVNAEALRSALKTNPRFLWLEASLVGRSGNTQTMDFSGSTFGGITDEPHLFFMRLSADYSTAVGATTVARWMTHARYNYRLSPIVSLEGLVQVQHDRFRRLGVRDLYGAGFRFDIVSQKELEVFAGTTYIFEHEVIEAIPTARGENNVWHRSSDYIGLNVKLASYMDASSVTYIQPRFDEPKDLRILSDSYISFTITKLLAMRVSGTLWYDTQPPAGVKTYDIEVKNTLALKLQ